MPTSQERLPSLWRPFYAASSCAIFVQCYFCGHVTRGACKTGKRDSFVEDLICLSSSSFILKNIIRDSFLSKLYTLTACQVIMGLSTIFFIIPVEGVVALTKLVRSWVVRPGAAFVENIHLFEKQKKQAAGGSCDQIPYCSPSHHHHILLRGR